MSMDIDVPIPLTAPEQRTAATILCCNCGAPIDGTTAANALCHDCIKLTVDISAGIPREATLHFCRDCDRWLQPPTSWLTAASESRELLALCLRRLPRLQQRVRVVDAGFIWTEPHSRRIRVRLTVQDEVAPGTVLQQGFEVVYVVAWQQCPDCAKSYTANVWRACVQVRQKVQHKRTFLLLEQLVLKHGAHRDTLNIKEAKDGIDFYFSARNQAEKFVDFLNSVVPVRVKKSQELISQDVHTSTKSYKFTFSAELVPICRDDFVALPLKLARQLGNISPMVLCHRIGTAIYFVDPATLQTADLSAPVYWRAPFPALSEARDLVEFVIIDIDAAPARQGRWRLAEATVARPSDLVSSGRQYFTRTHLGGILRPGDTAMGYLLTGTNFNSAELELIEASGAHANATPDVVLVKKHYHRKRGRRHRDWKLRRMDRDEGELLPKKADQERTEHEWELFLRDVEEDKSLREALTLYKNTRPRERRREAVEDAAEAMSVVETEEQDSDDEDLPKVDMEELVDELEDLTVEDR